MVRATLRQMKMVEMVHCTMRIMPSLSTRSCITILSCLAATSASAPSVAGAAVT